MRFYNVIFIEGVHKIGKSSQCVQLRHLLMAQKRPTHQINLDSAMNSGQLDVMVNNIREWCMDHPEGTLIVNGSLAYSFVRKDVENQKYGSSYDQFELPMKNFLNLLREFKILNLLLKSNDYAYLQSRYDTDFNPVEVKMLYDGFEYFENSQISNFKWQRVEISQYDSILKIHEKIKRVLE